MSTGRMSTGRMSASRDGREPLTTVRDRIRARVVGRTRELDLLLAAVAAGRDVLLEGPPGTSKSTLLRAITGEWGIPLVLVEGNADLTPAKLVGHHNPARVLREDYSPDNFVDGPLVEAMRHGGFLYIEEFNRAPEDTVNTLLTAMAERRIVVPRVGEVVAARTFRVIASMNPYDNIGTTRLSTSVHDRLCRLAVTYQDAAAERGIVALRAPQHDQALADQALADLKPARYERLVADAVAVTRATRALRGTSSPGLLGARRDRPDPGRRATLRPRSRTRGLAPPDSPVTSTAGRRVRGAARCGRGRPGRGRGRGRPGRAVAGATRTRPCRGRPGQ